MQLLPVEILTNMQVCLGNCSGKLYVCEECMLEGTCIIKIQPIQWNLRREDSTGTSHLSSLGRSSPFGGSCFYD